jgi:hypothetical protein
MAGDHRSADLLLHTVSTSRAGWTRWSFCIGSKGSEEIDEA